MGIDPTSWDRGLEGQVGVDSGKVAGSVGESTKVRILTRDDVVRQAAAAAEMAAAAQQGLLRRDVEGDGSGGSG